MSKPIAAGDLVMVVRGRQCCGWPSAIGKVFVVQAVVIGSNCYCDACKTEVPDDIARTGGLSPRGRLVGIELSRLIRIDPPALPESVETDREVVA